MTNHIMITDLTGSRREMLALMVIQKRLMFAQRVGNRDERAVKAAKNWLGITHRIKGTDLLARVTARLEQLQGV